MTKKRAAVPESPYLTRHRGGHSQYIGYARVSRPEQNLDSQLDALKRAGCCRVYAEKVSGAARDRPALAELCATLRKGDVVVVAALDRLGRALSELVRTLDLFRELGVHFRDLRHQLDTSSPHGRLMLNLLMVLAESERELIGERTREGLQAAKARGRIGGRPPLLTPDKRGVIHTLHGSGLSYSAIATTVGLSRASVRKALSTPQPVNPNQLKLREVE